MSQPSLDTFDVSLRKPFSCNPSLLQFLSNGFIFSSILFNAVELDVFEFIEQKPHNIESLAKEIQANQEGLDRLLNCLLSIGLLQKTSDGIYQNTELTKHVFTKSGSMYAADVFIHLKRHAYELFYHTAESIKTGKPQFDKLSILKGLERTDDNYGALSSLPSEYPLLLRAMNLMASGLGPLIATQAELHQAKNFLDIGGGGGQIVCDIAETCPTLQVSYLDLPKACLFATEYIQKRGLSERIHCISGDILDDNLAIKEKFDAILLAGVISDFSAEKRGLILQRAKSLLAPGGKLLLSETLLHEQKNGPVIATILSLYMFIGTGGQNYTPSEITKVLQDEGFPHVRIFSNNDLGARDLIIATL
jgi:2-polyprenyl-3-methyl-5-hydroxy-6-metoxy-1,4-benzoquinol methylase